MNVDLNNTNEYDKQVIFLDSKNGTYNDNNSFDFYIKFEDPIKNISNIKIIDASLILESSTTRILNNNDIYYIELNEYHRTFSYIKDKNYLHPNDRRYILVTPELRTLLIDNDREIEKVEEGENGVINNYITFHGLARLLYRRRHFLSGVTYM